MWASAAVASFSSASPEGGPAIPLHGIRGAQLPPRKKRRGSPPRVSARRQGGQARMRSARPARTPPAELGPDATLAGTGASATSAWRRFGSGGRNGGMDRARSKRHRGIGHDGVTAVGDSRSACGLLTLGSDCGALPSDCGGSASRAPGEASADISTTSTTGAVALDGVVAFTGHIVVGVRLSSDRLRAHLCATSGEGAFRNSGFRLLRRRRSGMAVFCQGLARQDFKRMGFRGRLFGTMRRREPAVPVAILAEIGPAAMPAATTTPRIKGPAVVRFPGGWGRGNRSRRRNRRGRRLRRGRRYAGGASGGGATSATTGGGGSVTAGAAGRRRRQGLLPAAQ